MAPPRGRAASRREPGQVKLKLAVDTMELHQKTQLKA